LLELMELPRIEKDGVGIERPQHSRDRPTVNQRVGVSGVGVVLFHRAQHQGELAQDFLQVFAGRFGLGGQRHAQGRAQKHDCQLGAEGNHSSIV